MRKVTCLVWCFLEFFELFDVTRVHCCSEFEFRLALVMSESVSAEDREGSFCEEACWVLG